jgi:hypothetical protein
MREKIYACGTGVYLAIVCPDNTAHLDSEDGGIPAVSGPDTPLRKAIQEAVGKARIDTRALAQTFRHRCAYPWLQAHDASRTPLE